MKKSFFLFIALIAFTLATNAQVSNSITRGPHKVDSNSVVKDSAGVRYSYADWRKLIVTGNYRLKVINPGRDSTVEFTLVKIDEETKARIRSMRPKPDESGYIKNGEKLELFSAKDIEGYKIRPKDLEGKVVVLNFWFIKCPPCQDEIPELNKIALSYANNPNIVFIAVALDEKDDLKKFLKDNPFAYHIVDDGREIASSYEIKTYPTSIILDKEGKVKLHT
ncbi:MAG: Peroxiredoxin, partial [Mucilaginibacter sp.]|nr:Peroxiredoxin [Mucilaginibacter sp.]